MSRHRTVHQPRPQYPEKIARWFDTYRTRIGININIYRGCEMVNTRPISRLLLIIASGLLSIVRRIAGSSNALHFSAMKRWGTHIGAMVSTPHISIWSSDWQSIYIRICADRPRLMLSMRLRFLARLLPTASKRRYRFCLILHCLHTIMKRSRPSRGIHPLRPIMAQTPPSPPPHPIHPQPQYLQISRHMRPPFLT